jgi:hypothetical protein
LFRPKALPTFLERGWMLRFYLEVRDFEDLGNFVVG